MLILLYFVQFFSAGEKIKLGFNYNEFAKDIIKNSKVKLFLVKNKNQLGKFLQKNMYGKKIVIGMGRRVNF